MDRTNTPPKPWFLCMSCAAHVLNRVSDPTSNDRQPIFVATGQVGDISAITPFNGWSRFIARRTMNSTLSLTLENPQAASSELLNTWDMR